MEAWEMEAKAREAAGMMMNEAGLRPWFEIPELYTYEKPNPSADEIRAHFESLRKYECCKTCHFYKWGGWLLGKCLRYAPAAKAGDVMPSDWCGEWKGRNETSDTR